MSLIYIKRRRAFVRHHGLEIYQLRKINDLRAPRPSAGFFHAFHKGSAMRLPVYQHPSLTVLVDDSAASLARLQFQLGSALTSKPFDDPRAAIAWLRRQHESAPQQSLVSPSDCEAACTHQHCVAFNVDRICRIGFWPGRFMLPSVLVVEQRMEAMSGVDFCAALAALPCKKILLIHPGDEGAALDAFNRGVIDRALPRDGADAGGELARAVAALKEQYFSELSEPLRAPLALHGFGFLADPAVAGLLSSVASAHGIVEYYPWPQPAGLLLADAEGRARLLVIETSAGMDTHHEVARDSGAPPSLLDAIEARCIVPFFRSGDGMYDQSVGERWYRNCEPARVFSGAQPYSWALFDLDAHELPEVAAPRSNRAQ
jgi:CheY-like chemotaxis protein